MVSLTSEKNQPECLLAVSVEHMDEALTPAPLSDKVLEHHKIFQVPIIVVPGLNHNAVRMQLETLLMQAGIRPEMVTVSEMD